MNFLVRSYLKKHSHQYVAAGLAILISTLFMTAATSFGNALNYALNYDEQLIAKGSDLVLSNRYLPQVEHLAVSQRAYKQNLENTLANDASLKPELKKLIADFFANEKREKGQELGSEIIRQIAPYVFRNSYLFNKAQQNILEAVPEIKGIYPSYEQNYANLRAGQYQLNAAYSILSEGADLFKPALLSGRYPEQENEVLLTSDCLKELKVKLGEKVQLAFSDDKKPVSLTIVGEVKQDFYHRSHSSLKLYVRQGFAQNNSLLYENAYRIQLSDKKAATTIVPKLKQYIEKHKLLNADWYILTKQDYLAANINNSSSRKIGIHLAVAVFPIVTLLVCFTIVASTFAVILARRRREIGLLRCIGASRKQLVKYSLLECLFVGLIFSALGAILAYILVFCLSVGFNFIGSYFEVWQIVGPWPAILSCLAATIITTLAGLRPAMENSVISPVEALQQINYEKKQKAKVRVILRIIFGIICLLAASFMFILALYFHSKDKVNGMQAAYAVPALILGACLYLLVLVTLGKFFLAKIAALCLKLFQSKSIVVRMASYNLMRNKERNGSTMSTLIMGLVMIVTTLIGAASLESSVYKGIKSMMPIDLSVSAYDLSKAIEPDYVDRLAKLPDVNKVINGQAWPLPDKFSVDGKELALDNDFELNKSYILAKPKRLSELANDKFMAAAKDEILVFEHSPLGKLNLAGKTLTLHYGQTKIDLKIRLLKQAKSQLNIAYNAIGIIQPETGDKLIQLGLPSKIGLVLAELKPNNVVLQQKLVDEIQKLSKQNEMALSGNIFFLAMFSVVLQTIKLMLVCLITIVAVVALIGVANTLNLSVLERRHETALLRAMGFTQKQVRKLLLIEGLSLGTVSLIIGSIVGLAFAVFGLYVLPLGDILARENYCIVIPWLECFGLSIFVLALVYIATLLPSKRASSASVVAELASSQE